MITPKLTTERRSPWLLALRREGPVQHRVFCFPYAGGGASVYRRLAHFSADGIEICAVQLPGREDRFGEPAFTRLSALVDALAPALTPHLEPPYSFFGHSMGALIAFELTRRLRRDGAPHRPRHLFVSGRRAPHLPDRRRPLHPLPIEELKLELADLQGTPPEVLRDPELMDLLVPVLRADFAVCETYSCAPDAPLDEPIVGLGGTDDPEATRDELDAWRLHTRAYVGPELFPGHHFYLQNEWPGIAAAIGRVVQSADLSRR